MDDLKFLELIREELKALASDTKDGFSGLGKKVDSLSERTTRLEERGKLSSRLMLGLSGALVVLGVVWRTVL